MALHHHHIRKRIHRKHEPFPHPNKWKRFLDRLIYAISIIGPVMTIPQVLAIWVGQNASGVSLVSWVTYLGCVIVWLIYGLVHKEKVIIFSNSLWVFMDVLVVIGILLYG